MDRSSANVRSSINFLSNNDQEQREKIEIQLIPALQSFQTFIKMSNESQMAQIVDSLMAIEFFKKNCPEGSSLRDFIMYAGRALTYEYYKKGQIIFHYGDYGDKFFMILKGNVAVLVQIKIYFINMILLKYFNILLFQFLFVDIFILINFIFNYLYFGIIYILKQIILINNDQIKLIQIKNMQIIGLQKQYLKEIMMLKQIEIIQQKQIELNLGVMFGRVKKCRVQLIWNCYQHKEKILGQYQIDILKEVFVYIKRFILIMEVKHLVMYSQKLKSSIGR